jgi:hypothetical protein
MHPATTQPGDIQATVVFVLFIVGLCVAYWRAALKMLAIILISLAVLSVIGRWARGSCHRYCWDG